ncbi:MAG: hypothetical protein WD826_03135 [Actinomycetota bacterium]
MQKHIRLFAAALAVALGAAGLMTFTPVARGAVIQDGPINYIGPGPCPADATDCTIATGDIDVVQKAPTTGRNEADCRGVTCKVAQEGSSGTARPTNVATCDSDTTAATSDQRCEISQLGTSNTINADLAATPSTGALVNLANVLQSSEQRFVTSQVGATNALNVKATINQSATSILDAGTPVNHSQSTLVRSLNTMDATSSNTADYQLNRTQTSQATGANPTQHQDTGAGAEADGAKLGLGEVDLVATSDGTNAIKVRGNDTKTQNATSLNLGQATQQEGHNTGGWLVDISGTDTTTANPGGAADVDLGTPGSSEGILKNWTQSAQGLLGGAIAKDQDQIDDIRLPSIGLSPIKGFWNAINKLRTDAGGHELCRASAEGHAKVQGSGRLTCDMAAGSEAKNVSVSWDAQTWKVSILCEINVDSCPGGTTTTEERGIDLKIWGTEKKTGKIPVAMLTNFDSNPATIDDASTIDPSTVCFGDAEDRTQRDCTADTPAAALNDVDGDGDQDLKMHFNAPEAGIDPGDTTACVHGRTYSGQAFEGCAPLNN